MTINERRESQRRDEAYAAGKEAERVAVLRAIDTERARWIDRDSEGARAALRVLRECIEKGWHVK